MTPNGICRRSLYRSSNSISASLGDEQFCSPWMGLCAGFSVCRFLVLTRPILTVGMGEMRNLSWF